MKKSPPLSEAKVRLAISLFLLLFVITPKHPTKVHIWAGISICVSTSICIFVGIMDRFLYKEIFEKTCLPFIQDVYPDGHRFMADNDPKHTSKDAIQYLADNGIYWWRTPAESPDFNPIEILCALEYIDDQFFDVMYEQNHIDVSAVKKNHPLV